MWEENLFYSRGRAGHCDAVVNEMTARGCLAGGCHLRQLMPGKGAAVLVFFGDLQDLVDTMVGSGGDLQ